MRAWTPREVKKILGIHNWRATYARVGKHPSLQELVDNYSLKEMERELSKSKGGDPKSTQA